MQKVHSFVGAAPEVRAVSATGLFTLATAIDRAGLNDVLEHEGSYNTVFAPSDEAFARLPDGAVQSLLAAPDAPAGVNYHLVPGLPARI